MKNNAALTLIEILAVLAILSMLIAIVPIAINNISPVWRLRGAANQIESEVLFAMNAAAARGKPAQLVYDLDSGGCWVRSGKENFAEYSLPGGVKFSEVRFATNISAQKDLAEVAVLPNGTVDPHTVTLETPGHRATISFDRLTGEPDYREESQ